MRQFWRSKLGGELPSQVFSADSDRASARGYRRMEHHFRIPGESARRLEVLNLRSGTTLFMALLAAIKVVLYRHTRLEDVIVGTAVAGRVVAELEQQVGPYLNVVPIRDTVAGDDRFETLLARVRESTLDAFVNQLYPFDWILDDLGVRRVPGRNPLFDVGFTLQNQRNSQAEGQPARLRVVERSGHDAEGSNAEALTDFWFVAEQQGGPIDVTIVYNGSLFGEATVRQLAADLTAVVDAAGHDATTRVHSFRVGRHAPPVTERVTIELAIH